MPLHQVDHERTVYCFSDASRQALSFVAFQIEGDPILNSEDYLVRESEDSKSLINRVTSPDTRKKFIVCFSRKLIKSEQAYSIFKLELMASIYGLLATKQLFLFTPLKLFTDSRGIIYLRLARNTSSQLARLSLLLSTFHVQIFHISSETNFLADYLSRPEKVDTDQVEEENRSFTEAESNEIVRHLLIPENLTIPSSLLRNIITSDSILTSLPGKRDKKKKRCSKMSEEIIVPPICRGKKSRTFNLK